MGGVSVAKRRKVEGVLENETINWQRAAAIFGNPRRPHTVWERQFDYHDGELWRIAQTPYKQFDFDDLWYYHQDLAYVELQPELFAYLFPVCLMDWHDTLQKNQCCSHGDSEFHKCIHRGQVLKKMITDVQRSEIINFFGDSFLCRLDDERGFVHRRSKTPAYGWLRRFNSLGLIIPTIDEIWDAWWLLESPGRAVAGLQYCSGLMYFAGENPVFDLRSKYESGDGPRLWEHDSDIDDAGWLEENVDFLGRTLTLDFVNEKVSAAVARLRNEPEFETARRIQNDLPDSEDLVAERVKELPRLLKDPNADRWTI